MKFLQDGSGNNSSTRLIAAIWFMGVFAAWGGLVIYTRSLPEIPASVLGLLGICSSWLVLNKKVEVDAQKDGA